ncbi:MAG: LrgB family protein [Clostridia bacterium]|nr:LrgB family protein [Clostridia bacterium]
MISNILTLSAYWGIAVSILGYGIGVLLNKKLKNGFVNPLLISITFVIIVLVCFNIDYEKYRESSEILSWLLTPATVCLAIPLYEQLSLLKDNYKAVLGGITAGVFTSLLSVFLLCVLFKFEDGMRISLLPKSITTAIGMGLAEELGGIDTIAASAIIITGIIGNVICRSVCKVFKITHPVAVGIAIGTASHAVGTTKAFEIGEVEGAMSSLSIAVSGIITVAAIQLFV